LTGEAVYTISGLKVVKKSVGGDINSIDFTISKGSESVRCSKTDRLLSDYDDDELYECDDDDFEFAYYGEGKYAGDTNYLYVYRDQNSLLYVLFKLSL